MTSPAIKPSIPFHVVLRLRRDHRAVLEHLDDLEAVLARTPDAAAVARAVRRLVGFLDRALPPHFAIEERELPPPAAAGLDEHADLRARLAAVRVSGSGTEARELALRLRGHIAAEEALLRGGPS